jgi:sugar fermentation stimulation protein A
MQFDPPLVPARLVARYKRFLFDAILADGTPITGSCPNTGSMRGLTAPGSAIWLSQHDSKTRKYRHMLEMVEADGTLVGINTGMPNRLAEEAIRTGLVADLATYGEIRREQRYGQN